MSRVRGLELLFNLEQKNFQSKEDCVIAAVHCLLINESFQCVGIGDEWPETEPGTTELLPKDWNSNQDLYSLRYCTKDKKSRILLKATKMEHILQIDAVKDEDSVASLPVPVNNYISDNYREYSSAYTDLESLVKAFNEDIIGNLNKPKDQKDDKRPKTPPRSTPVPPSIPKPGRSPLTLEDPRDPYQPRIPRNHDFDPLRRPNFPNIGGNDLDPFGRSGGGSMLMDPSNFGIPSRPTLPQFGVGGPGGLPRGAVPPGARFDPFMPPIGRDPSRKPNPDFLPPGFDDDFM